LNLLEPFLDAHEGHCKAVHALARKARGNCSRAMCGRIIQNGGSLR